MSFLFNDILNDIFNDIFLKIFQDFSCFSLETEPLFPRHGAGNRGSISSKTRLWKPEPNLSRARGNRTSDLLLTSLGPYQLHQVRVASPPIQERLLHSHRLQPPQIQTPKSKSQSVWSLDLGFWISDFDFWILDLGFWILDFGLP